LFVTSNIVLFFLSLGLIPYAIAAVTPGWRWLLGVAILIGGLLSALWIEDWVAASAPDFHEGVGGGIGRGLALIATIGFATGVVVRAFTLLLASRGIRPRYVIATLVAGFAIVPAIFVVPGLWHAWVMRPPSNTCLNATFKIKVGDATFAIPAAHMLNAYIGETSRRAAYYLFSNPSLRAFCNLSDNGNAEVKATQVWWSLDRRDSQAPSICAGSIADWAKTYCRAREATKLVKQDEIDFPLNIHVFAADEVRLGDFGGSRSTYDDSQHPPTRPGAPVFISSDAATPSGPLTFECTENGSGYWCKSFYAWRDGVTLGYSFQSARENVAARGSRIDNETRKFLSGFQPDR
jgi:hypothetical protein